jgi:anaerobic magnesium-protoporphyrin IX monomethyl ester cyclase
MDRKRVLLLNPPGDKLYIRDYYCSFSSKADYYWPPQDLIYQSGILDEEFSVEVVDAIINRFSEEKVMDIVSDSKPDAVIFTTGTATMTSDLQMMERIKTRTGSRIIASAGILKFLGLKFLEKYPVVDAMLLDFTEKALVPYIQGKADGPLRGLVYRKNGHLVSCEEKPSVHFQVPIPRHDLFDYTKYRIPIARRFPFTVVVTSLGCPYSCGFCTVGAFGYRTRDVEGVIAELQVLKGLGVKEILFQDPTFTVNTQRVVEICQKMVNHNLDFTWSCNGDIKSLNEEKIKHMKMAGCHTISLGIESGSDEILKKYSKMITTREIKDMIRLINSYKIRVLGYFIIGLPGEDRESIRKTIDLAKQLDIDIASFAIATPDIGTPLRQEALKKGWMTSGADVFDSTDFPIIETESLSKEDVWEMRSRAVREFYLRPLYLFKKFRQIRSIRDVKVTLSNALSLLRKS